MSVRPRKKMWRKKRPAAVTAVAWGIAVEEKVLAEALRWVTEE